MFHIQLTTSEIDLYRLFSMSYDKIHRSESLCEHKEHMIVLHLLYTIPVMLCVPSSTRQKQLENFRQAVVRPPPPPPPM